MEEAELKDAYKAKEAEAVVLTEAEAASADEGIERKEEEKKEARSQVSQHPKT